MKEYLKYIGIGITLILVGVWVDRTFFVNEREVLVPATVDIDSLRNVVLTEVTTKYVHKDSVLQILNEKNKVITLLLARKSKVVSDTIFVHDSSFVPIYEASLDTPLIAHISVVQGEDTVRQSLPLQTSFALQFIGGEYEVFNIERFAISPFTIQIPTKERFVEADNTIELHLTASSRYATGLLLNVGRWGGGARYRIMDKVWEIDTQFRLFGF